MSKEQGTTWPLDCSVCGPTEHVLDGGRWRCKGCGGITIPDMPDCPACWGDGPCTACGPEPGRLRQEQEVIDAD